MSVGVFNAETNETKDVANKSRTAIIDSEMSEESQNPLQNRVITQKITELNQSIEELNTLLNGMDETLGGKLDVSKIANNLVTTEEGYTLDARMGRILNEKVSVFNANITIKSVEFCYDGYISNDADYNNNAFKITFSGQTQTRLPVMLLLIAGQSGTVPPLLISFQGAGDYETIHSVDINDNDYNITCDGLSIIIPKGIKGGWGNIRLLKLGNCNDINIEYNKFNI